MFLGCWVFCGLFFWGVFEVFEVFGVFGDGHMVPLEAHRLQVRRPVIYKQ